MQSTYKLMGMTGVTKALLFACALVLSSVSWAQGGCGGYTPDEVGVFVNRNPGANQITRVKVTEDCTTHQLNVEVWKACWMGECYMGKTQGWYSGNPGHDPDLNFSYNYGSGTHVGRVNVFYSPYGYNWMLFEIEYSWAQGQIEDHWLSRYQ